MSTRVLWLCNLGGDGLRALLPFRGGPLISSCSSGSRYRCFSGLDVSTMCTSPLRAGDRAGACLPRPLRCGCSSCCCCCYHCSYSCCCCCSYYCYYSNWSGKGIYKACCALNCCSNSKSLNVIFTFPPRSSSSSSSSRSKSCACFLRNYASAFSWRCRITAISCCTLSFLLRKLMELSLIHISEPTRLY